MNWIYVCVKDGKDGECGDRVECIAGKKHQVSETSHKAARTQTDRKRTNSEQAGVKRHGRVESEKWNGIC